MNLKPPVSYQGAKVRLAAQIVDIMQPSNRPFYDLCCGSGAIALEVITRGLGCRKVTLLDKGPWGLFWERVSKGEFSIRKVRDYFDTLPKDLGEYRTWMQELSKQPAHIDTAEVFIILQAGAFGGKAIWISEGSWSNCSFRSYWTPTTTSSRRSPVNPMMPMPATLVDRLEVLCSSNLPIEAQQQNVEDFIPVPGSLIYIDPPYENLTSYKDKFNVIELAKRLTKRGCLVWVSEGRPLNDKAILLSRGRSKGGISGNRDKVNEEWLSPFFPRND